MSAFSSLEYHARRLTWLDLRAAFSEKVVAQGRSLFEQGGVPRPVLCIHEEALQGEFAHPIPIVVRAWLNMGNWGFNGNSSKEEIGPLAVALLLRFIQDLKSGAPLDRVTFDDPRVEEMQDRFIDAMDAYESGDNYDEDEDDDGDEEEDEDDDYEDAEGDYEDGDEVDDYEDEDYDDEDEEDDDFDREDEEDDDFEREDDADPATERVDLSYEARFDLRQELAAASREQLFDVLDQVLKRYPKARVWLADQLTFERGDADAHAQWIRDRLVELGDRPLDVDILVAHEKHERAHGVNGRLGRLIELGRGGVALELATRVFVAVGDALRVEHGVTRESFDLRRWLRACARVVQPALETLDAPAADKLVFCVEVESLAYETDRTPIDALWHGTHPPEVWSAVADRLRSRLQTFGKTPSPGDATECRVMHDRYLEALERAGREADYLQALEFQADASRNDTKLIPALGRLGRVDQADARLRRALERPGLLAGELTLLHGSWFALRKQTHDWKPLAADLADTFFAAPAVRGYAQLKAAAEKAGLWDATRPFIERFLETGAPPTLTKKQKRQGAVEWPLAEVATPFSREDDPKPGKRRLDVLLDVALHENRPDDAWRLYQLGVKEGVRELQTRRDRLAEMLSATQPDMAIRLWNDSVVTELAQGERNLPAVLSRLNLIHQLLATLGRQADWQDRLNQLRKTNARRPWVLQALDSLEERPVYDEIALKPAN